MTFEQLKEQIELAKIGLKELDDIEIHLRNLIHEKNSEIINLYNKLESKCVETYGFHKDNGGFMFGICTRCGAFLG